ncbi:DNA/RNA-binding protein [Ignicoccus hospitalis]|uniref:Alba, DNA/RNA-binding protein n=1 Tax=Ignicoccus hospitalis (strain KIN4/I / DSM 18386 / JCM 14125) TaxID=453591 RepID=A8A9J8_IGNH4|nr:DNA/RNA-binding protein [Ignicoccus hospitalis]ABU81600.1 Alba, DNA/RNA-binding protein [Ignicoccus hospitalis KIN4/I]
MTKEVIVVRDKPVSEYVLNAVVAFNSGAEEVEIVGRGRYISKAVVVFNRLRERLEETLKVVNVEIGSEESRRGRPVAYIKIRVTQGL